MSELNTSRRNFLTSSLIGLGALAASGAIPAALDADETRAFFSQEEALNEAWRLIEEEGAARVIIQASSIVSISKGRGFAPLARLLDSNASLLRGALVVESVAGRAAAAVFAKGAVAKLFARTASEGALEVLKEAGIPCEAKIVVANIMNRELTGVCPIEESTKGFKTPDSIIAAAHNALARLRANNNNNKEANA